MNHAKVSRFTEPERHYPLPVVQPSSRPRPAPDEAKRLNVNLDEEEHEELKELAREHGVSMSHLIRWGLDIIKDMIHDAPRGYRLIVLDPTNQPVKEYRLPF